VRLERWLYTIPLRLRSLFRRDHVESELDEEIRFHVERQIADATARGEDAHAARRKVALALGGSEQVKELCRDVRGTRWLEDLSQDASYALRTLRQKPGFAAVAILTIALGIGATTVMFTVVNGVLLKPLPYPEPERLVSMYEQVENTGRWAFAYFNFLDCQRESRTLSPMAAWRSGMGGTVSEPGEAEHVSSREISTGLFSVLGIGLSHGRGFMPDEDRPGGAPVAIISYRLWQMRFGGDPKAVGARLVFDAKAYTVVGIAPAGFQVSGDVDIFTPLGQNTAPWMQDREGHPGLQVIARLRPGATLAQAQAELRLIGRSLAKQYPKSNAGHSIAVQPFQRDVVGDIRPTLWLLLGAGSLVLLIACANVASLLLARAVSREREIAMRMALGASRSRLARQCLTESTILAVAGGVVGVLLAAIGTRPFLTFWPGGLPRADEITLDWRVLVFTLAASVLTGILFGLAPALRAPVHGLEHALRATARTVTSGSRRLHSGYVIAEIAIAIVLLIAAGTLGRTLLRLSSLKVGFDPHNVLVARVALSSDAVTNPPRTRAAWREILERANQVPGVQSAAIVDSIPMRGDESWIGYWTGPIPPPTDRMPMSQMAFVSPDYFRVMGIALLEGRFFTERDRIGSETVMAIDEVLAKRMFGGRGAVGKYLTLQVLGPAKLVGVVSHVRYRGLAVDDRAAVSEQMYSPLAQLPDPYLRVMASGMTLAVRTKVPPLNIVQAIRRQIRGSARDQVLYDIGTMEQLASGTLARQRFLLLLFGIFAGLALLLACIGIYGVLAYFTSQRIPEFGVRIALGATSGDLMSLVLRQSLGMISVGACIGLLAGFAAARLLKHLATGVRSPDSLTFVVMISVLVLAALFASFLPAHRASRTEPMSALRQE
jgi:predicted permease